ncbi:MULTISPECIES: glycosyltransferase [unclassified Luteococcus]|uniref:glycosyltransferase n=1 Tax=unclassified Luteococcus TaxID=2639923 RepID=UPI00313B88D5
MTRLAIGPANYAGQAHAWAKAVERHLGVPADSFNRGPVRRHEFRFDTDRQIPAPVFFAPLLRKARMKSFLRRYSHVALDGYQTFFQVPQRRDLAADVAFLREAGFPVALLAHGTDIRRPDAHIARHQHSYFLEGDEAWRQVQQARADRNNRIAQSAGVPLFVSTPDLLQDQPDATWLPICLDPSGYLNDAPLLERRVPRVLHMPSRAVPPIKGTQYVEPVLRRLHDEGLVEYVTPPRMPHREVPGFLRTVDIVIDQLLAGTYGVTAIEAMASGRVTVAAVGQSTVDVMPAAPPLVDATPDSLEEVIRGLVADREASRETAARGTAFVQRWHDGRHSANQLAAFLGVEPRPL